MNRLLECGGHAAAVIAAAWPPHSRTLLLALLLAAPALAQQQVTLDELIRRATTESPEVRAAAAAVDEARANAKLANAFHSTASLSTTPGYATGLPTAVLGQVPAIATVEAQRLLYDNAVRAERLDADSQVELATARLETRKREAAQRTAELAAQLHADLQLAANAQRRVAAYETMSHRAASLLAEGRARRLDVDRATLQLASAKRAAAAFESRIRLDRVRLSALTGVNPYDVTITAVDVPASAANPEIDALQHHAEALSRALVLTLRTWQPRIAAQVQYARLFDRFHRYYLNFKPDDFSAGASITLPIWSGGERAASVERARARMLEASSEAAARRAADGVAYEEASAAIRDAEEELALAKRGRDVAAEGLRVAQELAKEGRGEANDVELAQVALADADDDVVNAEAHVASARARLFIFHGYNR
jgi:outer membrane protein TolC